MGKCQNGKFYKKFKKRVDKSWNYERTAPNFPVQI